MVALNRLSVRLIAWGNRGIRLRVFQDLVVQGFQVFRVHRCALLLVTNHQAIQMLGSLDTPLFSSVVGRARSQPLPGY